MSDEKFKVCKICKNSKHLSEFALKKGYNIIKKTGEKKYYTSINPYCKICVNEQLTNLNRRTRSKKKVIRDDGSVNWATYLRRLRSDKKAKISLNEFKIWLQKQDQKCTYCEYDLATIKKILKLFLPDNSVVLKSNKFQIDRMDNKKGYTIGNICFACAICNTHKKDFFEHEEFKLISKKYIVPIIQKKLKNIV